MVLHGFLNQLKGGATSPDEHSVDCHIHLLKELHRKTVDGQFQTCRHRGVSIVMGVPQLLDDL